MIKKFPDLVHQSMGKVSSDEHLEVSRVASTICSPFINAMLKQRKEKQNKSGAINE